MQDSIYLITGLDPVTLNSTVLGSFTDADVAAASLDVFSEHESSLIDLDIAEIPFYDEVPLLKTMYLVRAFGSSVIVDSVLMPDKTEEIYMSNNPDEDGEESIVYILTDSQESADDAAARIKAAINNSGEVAEFLDRVTAE